ncbi:hypothetical protein OG897_27470 [Streptomyces sp. NBC_00237]|uniref:hypothetical protein n=1 Tax=Streptomyces sp. NBC_00237 TaxID=2975687 RepID=UPI0022596933|nr:hypothetical protein [Streptomyces sp. NBC_00237]MCX5205184.1 hypothetical protein [Streptomyces sp. NBC_00237]
MKAKLVVSAVACAALIVGVSGCADADAPGSAGSDKKTFDGQSPDQIADASVTATKKADSVRIRTEATANGRSAASDYVVDTQGNCQGTNTQQDAKAELRRVDSVTYLKGNQQYWEALLKQQGSGAKGKKAAATFQDKWVKLPPAEAKATQAGCDKDAVIALLDRDKSERKGMTRAKDTELDGKDSAVLQKKTAQGETITMYVAAEGEPYVLKVEQKGGKAPMTTTFSDYGKPVDAKAPPAGEVVDPQKQQGGTAAS